MVTYLLVYAHGINTVLSGGILASLHHVQRQEHICGRALYKSVIIIIIIIIIIV